MTENFFEITNLTHQFADGTVALNNLSLSIPKGKKIALLGNNGAGKSTLFLHLNGILEPTNGSIMFNGEPVSYHRKGLFALRKQVNIVFQDPDSQLFSSNVMQDISFGPLNLGLSQEEARQRVEWAMQQTEVTEFKDKPTHFLSLGQKKRVAIAGVLAMEPDVFILDEPTAGLDTYYSRQIMHVLNSIHGQDKTIILSTHDVNLAYEWADEVIVMNNGEIIYTGDPITIFRNHTLVSKAHLEKPWILDTFDELVQKEIITNKENIPRDKNTLFSLMKERQFI